MSDTLSDDSSFWGEYDAALALSGIFVDETPTQYTPDFVSYLRSISQAVRDSAGLKDSYIGMAFLFISIIVAPVNPRKYRPLRPLLYWLPVVTVAAQVLNWFCYIALLARNFLLVYSAVEDRKADPHRSSQSGRFTPVPLLRRIHHRRGRPHHCFREFVL